MSGTVKSGIDAIKIAYDTARNAGLVFFTIAEAKQDDGTWIVTVESFGNEYQARIESTSGAVTEWKRTKKQTKTGS